MDHIIEKLRARVSYNPVTGEMKRTFPPGRNAGRKPHRFTPSRIMIERKLFSRAKVAIALATGTFPLGPIYFVDGNNTNYALANLTPLQPRKPRRTKNTKGKNSAC
jgi:hypothetical protein